MSSQSYQSGIEITSTFYSPNRTGGSQSYQSGIEIVYKDKDQDSKKPLSIVPKWN